MATIINKTEKDLSKLRLHLMNGADLDPIAVSNIRATEKTASMEEMRQRFREDGYLLMKGLLPREDVLEVRRQFFLHMQSTSILDSEYPPERGVFNQSADPATYSGPRQSDTVVTSLLTSKLVQAHVLPAYISFLKHPRLREFVKSFMQWKREILLSRTMLRQYVPGGQSSGVHYDQIYLRAGDPEAEFLTAWIPFGDIPVEAGGLMYLEKSDKLGRELEAGFMAKAQQMTPAERNSAFNANMMASGLLSNDADEYRRNFAHDKKWLVTDYEAGDVVFHNPYILHASVVNHDQRGMIRLSTDLRFYEEGVGLDRRWMKTWTPKDGL